MPRISLSVDQEFFDALDKAAQGRFMTPQQFVLDCARRALGLSQKGLRMPRKKRLEDLFSG